MTYTLSLARTKKPNRYYDSAEDFTNRTQEIMKEQGWQKKEVTPNGVANVWESCKRSVDLMNSNTIKWASDKEWARTTLDCYFGPETSLIKPSKNPTKVQNTVSTAPLRSALSETTTSLPWNPTGVSISQINSGDNSQTATIGNTTVSTWRK